MGKRLIIAEKPSVAMQFAKTLGVHSKDKTDGYIEDNNWIVTWCVGHLVGLSYPQAYDEKYKSWKLENLPFLPKQYLYEVTNSKQFNIVKKLLNRNDVDIIYNAGDAGREGEYIQRLVYMQAKVNKPIKRIWIDSQTDAEIKRGIKEAKSSSAYDNLANAGYERAIADYAVGINFTEALSAKYGKEFNSRVPLSKFVSITVGRVMTCVLGMIVDREHEIDSFIPTDYFKIDAEHGFKSHWKPDERKYPDKLYEDGFKIKSDADDLLVDLLREPYLTVNKIDRKAEKQNAPLLFNLAELQSECTKRFKISPSQTLSIAQSLYEKKYTTYPRTDARVLSTAVCDDITVNLQGLSSKGWNEADDVLAKGMYKGLSGSKYVGQVSDHYAIIPTGEGSEPLEGFEEKIYNLIVRRFLAIFYPPAIYDKAMFELLHSSGERFIANEKILRDPGFKAIYKTSDEQNDTKPAINVNEGDKLKATFAVVPTTTKPPKRYTSGSMILAMENAGKLIDNEELRAQIKGSGIGTSSTRADIISKLEKIDYINLDSGTQELSPTSIGEGVYGIVKESIPSLLSPKMTASWEKGLTQVEIGEISPRIYRDKIENFVSTTVDKIKSTDSVSMPEIKAPDPVGKCPRCGKPVMEFKTGYGCSGYSKDDDNSCKFFLNKNPPILAKSKKSVTRNMAKQLLIGKTVEVKGLISKNNKKYTAQFTMNDTGEYVNLEMSFKTKKK